MPELSFKYDIQGYCICYGSGTGTTFCFQDGRVVVSLFAPFLEFNWVHCLILNRKFTKEYSASCGRKPLSEVRAQAVHLDLQATSLPALPQEITSFSGTLSDPLVLQILKVKNLSTPNDQQESGSSARLLRLQLTDGHTACFALETERVPQLHLDTEPGTKVHAVNQLGLSLRFALAGLCRCSMDTSC